MSAKVRPGGVGFYCDGLSTSEVETSTCAHCSKISDIPTRRKMMDHVEICRACMRLICLECAGKPCMPMMKKIEAKEREYYQREQLRKSMGF